MGQAGLNQKVWKKIFHHLQWVLGKLNFSSLPGEISHQLIWGQTRVGQWEINLNLANTFPPPFPYSQTYFHSWTFFLSKGAEEWGKRIFVSTLMFCCSFLHRDRTAPERGAFPESPLWISPKWVFPRDYSSIWVALAWVPSHGIQSFWNRLLHCVFPEWLWVRLPCSSSWATGGSQLWQLTTSYPAFFNPSTFRAAPLTYSHSSHLWLQLLLHSNAFLFLNTLSKRHCHHPWWAQPWPLACLSWSWLTLALSDTGKP